MPLYVLAGTWVVMAAVNFGTGRSLRFYLALSLWTFANTIMLASGKGMFQAFLFVVLPSVLVGVTDYFGLGPITVEMVYLIPALNLIPYCWSGALKRYFPERNQLARRYRLGPQVTLFALAGLLSAALGHGVKYPTQSLRAVGVIFVIPFFFYLYTSHAVRRLVNVKQVSVVLVSITAFYSAIMGIFQLGRLRSHYAQIARNLVIYPMDKIDAMWKYTYGEGKIISVWPDAASFGHVLCFVFPLALGLALLSKTPKVRILYFLSLGLILTGVMITGNRTDIIGAFLTFTLIVIAYWNRSATLRGLLIRFAVIGFVAAAAVTATRQSNGLTRLFMPQEWDVKTASSRTILIHEGLRMFKSSPLFGIGLDNFKDNQDYRVGDVYMVGNYAHNLFIQILAETGIVGFLCFAILMGSVFYLAPVLWRHRAETEMDFFCFLFLVGCIVLVIQGLVENSLFYVQTASLFWTGAGIWRGRAMELKCRETREGP
jgi:O-antigen ligase